MHLLKRMAFVAAISLAFSASAAQKPVGLLNRPYAPLMAPMGPWQPGPEITEGVILHYANTYRMINSHGGVVDPERPEEGKVPYWGGPSFYLDNWNRTAAENIRQINAGFLMSNYRNGSYIQQNCPQEAQEVESGFPLGIAVWDTKTTLTTDIDETQTEIAVVAPGELPKHNSEIWPFKTSTVEGLYSESPNRYVAWLRMGDEIMRIEKAEKSGGEIRLTVQRGYWKTEATAHDSRDKIFMPVYIGSVTAGGDVALSGVPDNKSPQLGIRYALQQQNPDFHEWLAGKCERIFAEGYDVTWLDVATSTWYNNGDAYANPVTPYDLENDREMTAEQYCVYQQIKFDAMFEAFPGKLFFVNNIKASSYFDRGQERRLLSGEGGHHPVSGGAMENYAIVENLEDWIQEANMTLDYINSGFDGVAWSKTQQPMEEYHLFAYATYLMAWRPGEKLMFGGQWIRDGSRPEEYFYYDLGEPEQDFSTIDEAKAADLIGVYSRDFAKAKVILNASSDSQTIPLPAKMYHPQQKAWVSEVELPSQKAVILLKHEIQK